MNVDQYLQRIGWGGKCDPTAETLTRLHRAQMYSVPFENLDIPLGRPIVLSLPLLFDKIVLHRRGGFCYELNGLFAWLLQEIGFQVEMLSARVFSQGRFGPDFDHMLLLVGSNEKRFADVGFGDSFIEPIPMGLQEHSQHGRTYRFVEQGDGFALQQRKPESGWEPQYCFSLQPRQLEDYEAMCHFQQTSPDSSFTRKSVCSLATPEGRITLSNGRLIVTTGDRKEERRVENLDEYRALLKEHFGMDLPEGLPAERLLQPNLAKRASAEKENLQKGTKALAKISRKRDFT